MGCQPLNVGGRPTVPWAAPKEKVEWRQMRTYDRRKMRSRVATCPRKNGRWSGGERKSGCVSLTKQWTTSLMTKDSYMKSFLKISNSISVSQCTVQKTSNKFPNFLILPTTNLTFPKIAIGVHRLPRRPVMKWYNLRISYPVLPVVFEAPRRTFRMSAWMLLGQVFCQILSRG